MQWRNENENITTQNYVTSPFSEIGATLRGKNLLSREASSLHSEHPLECVMENAII